MGPWVWTGLLLRGGCRRASRRGRPGLTRVHVFEPPVPILDACGHHIEERLLDRFGDRSAASVADRDLVDAFDWRDLGGGPDEERLVRDVEQFARQHLLAHLEPEVVSERDDGSSRD